LRHFAPAASEDNACGRLIQSNSKKFFFYHLQRNKTEGNHFSMAIHREIQTIEKE